MSTVSLSSTTSNASQMATTFRNAVKGAVLQGGTLLNTAVGATTTTAEFSHSVSSAVLAGGQGSATLATSTNSTTDFAHAVASAVLTGSASDNTIGGVDVGGLAALGKTLDAMAATAQRALMDSSAADRAKAAKAYQALYDQLNTSAGQIKMGNGWGSASKLGVVLPGDWGNANPAIGTAAIRANMTNVVKTHLAIHQTIQSVGATRTQLLVLNI